MIDFYRQIAAADLGVPEHTVTPEQRQEVKLKALAVGYSSLPLPAYPHWQRMGIPKPNRSKRARGKARMRYWSPR
jgi:hypothetical protein